MVEFAALSDFYEIAALLALAAAMGMLGLALRQPLIVAFIAVGIVAGPSVLGLARSTEQIELLSELGVSVLLFLVGLQLDVKLIRLVGVVSAMTGLGQVIFTSLVGYFICLWLGLTPIASLYAAVALTFSSTIIIVKLLSDKRELDSLHGRIALGFLIVQDLVVILALIVLSASGIGAMEGDLVTGLAALLAKGAAFIGLLVLFVRYAATWITRRVARSPELTVCFAIAWATLLASLGEYAGFSMEVGGLLAGVSLASTPYRDAIASRLISIRDFMLLFFFVALGSRLDLSTITGDLFPAFVLSLFVLIGNPIIVMVIMGIMGYTKRTGFLAGLTVAQISEFSLIFMAMGQSLGDVDAQAVGLVTLVGLITIGLSTYMILYSQPLYELLEPLLRPFERRNPYRERAEAEAAFRAPPDVVLFGLGRYGGEIARALRQAGRSVLCVDFDPQLVRRFLDQGFDAIHGDAADSEFVGSLPLHSAAWLVNAIHTPYSGPTSQDNRLLLLANARQHGFSGRIALTAHDARDAVRLRQAGADLVLMPFVDASKHAAELLLEGLSVGAAEARPQASAR